MVLVLEYSGARHGARALLFPNLYTYEGIRSANLFPDDKAGFSTLDSPGSSA
jgi:hypothetical protein